MPANKARRTDLSGRAGRPDGVIYRQQYVRCGKVSCRRCPPSGPGHGPYWYGYYWDYRRRTRSFYVGKTLPVGVELIGGPDQTPSSHANEGRAAQPEHPTPGTDARVGDSTPPNHRYHATREVTTALNAIDHST